METELNQDRDTELIGEYLELLDRNSARRSPFARLAALAKLGIVERKLRNLVDRHPEPELERLEAIAESSTSRGWFRRLAAGYWGSRVLLLATVLIGHQLVLGALSLTSAAYTGVVGDDPQPSTGELSTLSRLAVIFLVLFVFAFYLTPPLLSFLGLWGGRFLRSWRVTVPAVAIAVLASAGCTYLSFRSLSNPAFTKASLNQFIESRLISSSDAYRKWLDMNWLLKDERFRSDYESYLKNGPGRWLTNRFDTTDPAAWADADPATPENETLKYIGEFVDQQHDQTKFRDWLKDYVERNHINSRDIDRDIDGLIGAGNQRFLAVWQAEPYLRQRDVYVRQHYYEQVGAALRQWGLVMLGVTGCAFALAYAVGPCLLVLGWLARSFRMEWFGRLAERLRSRYYRYPEINDLGLEPYLPSTTEMLEKVHRGFIHSATIVSLVFFGLWALWLARDDGARATTQAGVIGRYVVGASAPSDRPNDPGQAVTPSTAPTLATIGAPSAFGDPAFGAEGDEKPPPVEQRLLALERAYGDADYEMRKRFKTTDAVLASYKKELEELKRQAQQLERENRDLATLASGLQSQLGSAGSAASSATARAEDAIARAEDAMAGLTQLGVRADELDRRTGDLERASERLENETDVLAADLDAHNREMTARTEELADRAAGLDTRVESIADLQRTAYRYVVDQIDSEVAAIERRSESRMYRMFNRREALVRLDGLRGRIQTIRAMLQYNRSPEARLLMSQLTALLERITPIETRFH
jgi:predicted  nucleic acid-binding Zn-ribbon protein